MHSKKFNGKCAELQKNEMCLVGKRKLEIFLLTGPVLAVWNPVQEILNQYDKNSRIQVVRLRTADEKRLVGLLIPSNCAASLSRGLAEIEKSRPKGKPGRRKKSRLFTSTPGVGEEDEDADIEKMAEMMVMESKSESSDQNLIDERKEVVEEPEVFEDVEGEKEGELDPDQEAELERMAQRMIDEADLF